MSNHFEPVLVSLTVSAKIFGTTNSNHRNGCLEASKMLWLILASKWKLNPLWWHGTQPQNLLVLSCDNQVYRIATNDQQNDQHGPWAQRSKKAHRKSHGQKVAPRTSHQDFAVEVVPRAATASRFEALHARVEEWQHLKVFEIGDASQCKVLHSKSEQQGLKAKTRKWPAVYCRSRVTFRHLQHASALHTAVPLPG